MRRSAGELSRAHPDTNAILAGMCKTTNILMQEVSKDFDFVWTKRNECPLPFKCFPNVHQQLFWHDGCNKLPNKRQSNYNIDAHAIYQQTAILRVTFKATAKQQMGSIRMEDQIIQAPPSTIF